MAEPDICIVAARHPSLDQLMGDFLEDLRCESRFFGPRARANPKPDRSLIDGLARLDGLRIAAIGYDRVVGACRVGSAGELLLAVAPGRRGQGIGTALLTSAAARAADLGWTRLLIRSSRRSEAMQRAASNVGAVALDTGQGRLEMLLDTRSVALTA